MMNRLSVLEHALSALKLDFQFPLFSILEMYLFKASSAGK